MCSQFPPYKLMLLHISGLAVCVPHPESGLAFDCCDQHSVAGQYHPSPGTSFMELAASNYSLEVSHHEEVRHPETIMLCGSSM